MKKIMIIIALLFFNSAVFSMRHNQEIISDFILPESMLEPRGDFRTDFSPAQHFIDVLKSQLSEVTSDREFDIFKQSLLNSFSIQDINYINSRAVNYLPISRETAQHGYRSYLPEAVYATVAAVLTRQNLLNHRGYVKILHEDKRLLQREQKIKLLFINPFLDYRAVVQHYDYLREQRNKEVSYNYIYPEHNVAGVVSTKIAPLDNHTFTSSSIPKAFTIFNFSSQQTEFDKNNIIRLAPENRASKKIQYFNVELFNLDKKNNREKKEALDILIKTLIETSYYPDGSASYDFKKYVLMESPVQSSGGYSPQGCSSMQSPGSYASQEYSPVSNFSNYSFQTNSPTNGNGYYNNGKN